MKTLSLAVLLLIGDVAAEKLYRNRHGRSYVQFLEGDFDDLNQDFIAEQQTKDSVQEAEKQMGKSIKTDSETMNASLDHYTKLNFDQDGETFSKATSVADNVMVELPTYFNPVPGVTMIQSDPIHGSLGEPKIKLKDLTPEQQFEELQRRKTPVVFKDDKEQTIDTDESLKWAEENTGQKMSEPIEKKKMKKPVKYTLHDSDDEDEDTVETRKSVKTSEKQLKKRFFINAKEERDYSQAINDGRVSDKQVNFQEDEDEELGPADPNKALKDAAKKQFKLDAVKKKHAERHAPKSTLTPKEKKEKAEAEEKEAEIAKAKEDREDNAPPKPTPKPDPPKVEGAPTPPTPSDLPPELAGALGGSDLPPELAGALAQKRQKMLAQQMAKAEEESDSDSDSGSDSDSD